MAFLDDAARSHPLRTAAISAAIVALGGVILAWTEGQSREDVGEGLLVVALSAAAAALFSGLLHAFTRLRVFKTPLMRWLALFALPALLASILYLRYLQVQGTEKFAGLLEYMLMLALIPLVLLTLAAFALQLVPQLRSWKVIGSIGAAVAVLGLVALVAVPSRELLDRQATALARAGFLECNFDLTEEARIADGVVRFENEQGSLGDGELDASELEQLEALPARSEWKVGDSEDADTADLNAALARACATPGAVTIALEAGRYTMDLGSRGLDSADLFGWSESEDADASEAASKSVTIRGAGSDATQIDLAHTIYLGEADRLEQLSVRDTSGEDGPLIVMNGGSTLADLVIDTGGIGQREDLVEVRSFADRTVSLFRVRFGAASSAQLTIGEASYEDEAATGRVIASELQFDSSEGTALFAYGNSELQINGSDFGRGGVQITGNVAAEIRGSSFDGASNPSLLIADDAKVEVTGGEFARNGDVYCIIAEGQSQLTVREAGFSGCSNPSLYRILLQDNARADFANNRALTQGDINQAGENVRLAFATPEPAALAQSDFSDIATSYRPRQSLARSQAHMEWLLYNYWNALSAEATSCAFVASSNRGRVGVSNFFGGLCLLSDASCEFTRELQEEIVAEQEQCWNEMASEFNRIHSRAIMHEDSCPRLNNALNAYSRWWYPEAREATTVTNEDPMGRTSRFNDRAGQRFVDVITTNTC